MERKTRVMIRWIIFVICLIAVVYFHRTVGKAQLLYQFIALGGLLAVLYDYNRDYTHPKRDR